MKSSNVPIFVLALIIILAGCATHIGKTSYPEPTAGFVPKQTYAVPYDKLWDASVSALDANRITVISADKVSGIIQTDYIEGPSALIAGGLVGSQSTRYKFNITLRNQSGGNIKLTIFCKVESTIHSGSGSSQWTDVSGQNAALVKNLETWLYEEIEKAL